MCIHKMDRFEESQIDHIPKDSPTCSTESLRVILAIMAQNQWMPNSVDIKKPSFSEPIYLEICTSVHPERPMPLAKSGN